MCRKWTRKKFGLVSSAGWFVAVLSLVYPSAFPLSFNKGSGVAYASDGGSSTGSGGCSGSGGNSGPVVAGVITQVQVAAEKMTVKAQM